MKEKNKHISTECYPCIFQQLSSLAALVKLNDVEKKSLFEESMQYLLETHGEGIVVQHIIRKATDSVIDLLNKPSDFDPYRAIKTRSNDIARSYSQVFKEI